MEKLFIVAYTECFVIVSKELYDVTLSIKLYGLSLFNNSPVLILIYLRSM